MTITSEDKNYKKLQKEANSQEKLVIKDSLVKFYNATENSFSGIFILDENFKIIYLNQAAAQARGFKRADLAAKNFLDFINKKASFKKNNLLNTIKEGDWEGEIELINKNNQKRMSKIFISQLPKISDKRKYFLVIENKLADPQKTKERLKESEDRFKSLFKYAPDAYYLCDLKGKFLDGNKACEKLIGYNKKELIGKNFLKLKLLTPDQIPKAAALLAKNALGQPTGPDEFTLIKKNGSKIAIEVRSAPVKIQGKTLVLGIARDITERKRMKKKLEESEEKYRTLIEKTSDIIYSTDSHGNLTYISPQISKFGYKPEKLIGKNIIQYIYPDDRKKIMNDFQKTITTGQESPSQFRLILNNQKDNLRWFEETGRALRDEQNKIIGITGIIRDITERKIAEHKIKESEQKYRTLFEASADGILIADIATTKFEYANPAICKMLGYTAKELIDKSMKDIHPKDKLDQVMAEFKSQAKEEKSLAENIPCLRKDGSIFYADINTTAIIINGKNLNVGFFRDITQKKKLEDSLRLEKEKAINEYIKINTILQSIGDGVIVVDKAEKIIFLNPVAENLTGWTTKQAQGKNLTKVFNIFDEKSNKKRKSPVTDALKKGEITKLANHTIIKRKDGQVIPIADSASPVKNETGKINGAVLVFRDVIKERIAEKKIITAKNKQENLNQELDRKVEQRTKQLKKALEELKSLDALKDEFLNISAHELKTPLTSIIGLSELLLLKKQGSINSKQKKSLKIVNDESNRLLNIIKKILNITRIEAGKAIFDLQIVDLCPIAEKTIESLKQIAEKNKVKIICQKPSKPIFVKVDPERIQEVIYNLIDNAIKFSPQGGEIIISGKINKNNEFIFSVKDQGSGIAKAKQKKLFKKFSQLDTGFARKQEGTGLGLYISKIILDNMNGKIWVESEKGKGATFKFSLPIAKNKKNAS